MNIEFQSRSFDLDDDIRSYAQRKLQKVTRFLEEPIEIRVTLQGTKHGSVADLHVAHRHDVLQVEEETDEMRDAINLAVDKMQTLARRSRKKFQGRRRRADRRTNGANAWPLEVLERDSVSQTDGPTIIETTELTIKPMSLEEAALQLEGSKNEFIVFRDSASEQVSVLYRRQDNDYGLIARALRERRT